MVRLRKANQKPSPQLSSTNKPAPAKYPANASQLIFLKYQMKSIFKRPIMATPAALPMMSTLPPVPAQ